MTSYSFCFSRPISLANQVVGATTPPCSIIRPLHARRIVAGEPVDVEVHRKNSSTEAGYEKEVGGSPA